MAEYVLIESRDPFESNDVGYYYDLARGLVESGNQVTLFLAQNGVLAARPSAVESRWSSVAVPSQNQTRQSPSCASSWIMADPVGISTRDTLRADSVSRHPGWIPLTSMYVRISAGP